MMNTKTFIMLGLYLGMTQQSWANSSDSAVSVVDSFEKVFGVTEGKRRNHTKGFCFEGVLVPNDISIQQYSDSALFKEQSPVTGRLSHKGGNNHAADDKPGEYGLALAISNALGQKHMMSMNTLDFFPVSTPEAFAELMRAKATGSDAVKEFKQKSPELQNFKAHEAKKTPSLIPYEGHTYNSINSFYLVAADGKKTAVRWAFVPIHTPALVVAASQNFLFENMQKNLRDKKVGWAMQVMFANPEDKVNDASIKWVGKHKTISAATLEVTSISKETDGRCDLINYDPLVLSSGFAASEDPLLQARRTSYALSFAKRVSEKALIEQPLEQ